MPIDHKPITDAESGEKLDQVDDKLDQIIAAPQEILTDNQRLKSGLDALEDRGFWDRVLNRKPQNNDRWHGVSSLA
jgi:hypothetical protein